MAEAFLSRVLRPMVSRALKKALGGVFMIDKSAELEVSALKGVIALTDVQIQPNLAIPGVEVIDGTVGRLELRIPWQKLGSEPVQVLVSRIKLKLRAALSENVSDLVKKNRLKAAEILALAEEAEDEAKEDEDHSESTEENAGLPSDEKQKRRWIDRVVENIALTVEDIEIRLLTPVHASQDISLLFTVDSFSLETTDDEGQPAYVSRQDETVPLHRRGLLRGFSVQLIDSSVSSSGVVLLEPIWISCMMQDGWQKQRVLDCRFGPMRIRVSPLQVQLLLAFTRRASSLTVNSSVNRELRPALSPRPIQNVRSKLKSWILYALSMFRLEQGQPRHKLGWRQFCERARDRSRYVALYRRRLAELDAFSLSKKEQTKAKMSDSEVRELNQLERKLPYNVVLLFRSFAEAEVAYLAALSGSAPLNETSGKKKSRFAVIRKLGLRSRKKKCNVEQLQTTTLSIVERQRLYEQIIHERIGALGSQEDETNSTTPFGATFATFRLSSVDLTLESSTKLKINANGILVAASFFVDSPTEIDFSITDLELSDVLSSNKILSFEGEGYRIDRSRSKRFSIVGSASGLPSRKVVKSRISFNSQHLINWKEATDHDGGDGFVRIHGRLGGIVQVSPLKVKMNPGATESLLSFAPGSGPNGKPMTTRVLLEKPVFSFVDEKSVPILNFDSDNIDWCGTVCSLRYCGLSFDQSPRCLPVDIAYSRGTIEVSLSQKSIEDDAVQPRIRLEVQSRTLLELSRLASELRKNSNGKRNTTLDSTQESSRVLKILSAFDLAVTDLGIVIESEELAMKHSASNSGHEISCRRMNIYRTAPKRRILFSSGAPISATALESGSIRVEIHDEVSGRTFCMWDATLFRSIIDAFGAHDDRPAKTKPSRSLKFAVEISTECVIDLAAFPMAETPFIRVLSSGLKYEGKHFHLQGPIIAESLWMCDERICVEHQDLSFLSCDGSVDIRLLDRVEMEAMGLVRYKHFQTLAQEFNDYFQTQIAPFFAKQQDGTQNSRGPPPYALNCTDGFLMELSPAALPKDVTSHMDKFLVSASSMKVQSTERMNGCERVNAVIANCEVERREGGADAADLITVAPVDVRIEWTRSDLSLMQSDSIIIPPLVHGVRKDMPYPRRRSNKFLVKVTPIQNQILKLEVSRTTARVFLIALSENLKDARRVYRGPDDVEAKASVEKWMQELLPVSSTIRLETVDDELKQSEQFLNRELIIDLGGENGVEIKLKMLPTATDVIVASDNHLIYHSKEIRHISRPLHTSRPSSFYFGGHCALSCTAKKCSDIQVASFSISRCSWGFNKDEMYDIRIGKVSSKSVRELPVYFALVSFLAHVDREKERMFDQSVANAKSRWAKHFRISPIIWECLEENVSISLKGSVLQSRKRADLNYSLMCSLDQPHLLEQPVTFRADGMHSSEARQHSILCDPVRAHASFRGFELGAKWVRDVFGDIRETLKALRDGPGKLEDEVIASDLNTVYRKPDILVVIALRGLQFTLLSPNNKPCLRLFASKTILRNVVKSGSSERSLSFTFFDEDGASGLGFGVNYFNQSIVRWEPLLEQAVINVDAQWNTAFNALTLVVESTDPIKLNVTVNACETINRLLVPPNHGRMIETSNSIDETYSEWVFENDSGEDVTLELDDIRTNVPQGSKIPLRGFDLNVQEPRTGTIHFASPFHPLRDITLNAIGYFSYPLYPLVTAGGHRQTRMVQVSLCSFVEDGIMVVKLCSAVAVENQTGVPLEILLMPTPQNEVGEELTGRSAVLGPLPTDANLSLPVQCLTTRLSIRPVVSDSETSKFAWWTGMSVFALQSGSFEGGCDGIDDATFSFVVNVQELSSGAVSRREGRFRISFLPALTIVNALPVELDFRFSGHNDRIRLSPGETGKAHEAIRKLLFRVGTSAWSEPLVIENRADTSSILLEDSHGKHLKLLVETKITSTGSLCVIIFAKAWFLNRSGLPLAYRTGETGLRLFDTKTGQSFAGSNALVQMEDALSPGEIKMGSACEFLFGEVWMQCVIVGSRDHNQTFDIVLTDNGVKVGAVKPIQLRKHRHHPHQDEPQVKDSGEYVLFSELGGTLQVKIDSSSSGSMWSAPFSIDHIGTDGMITLKREVYPSSTHTGVSAALNVLGQHYVLGVHVGQSKIADLKPTPVVTLVPRHVVVNKLDSGWGLVVASEQLEDLNRISITEERVAAHCMSGKVRLGIERLADFSNRVEHNSLTRSGYSLSGVVDISKPCHESIKLHNKRSGECVVLSVEVDWLDSSVPTLVCTISRSKSPIDAFYWVVNETKESIVHYHQVFRDPTTGLERKGVVERLFPGEGREFGWDEVGDGHSDSARAIDFDFGADGGVIRVYPDDLSASPFREGNKVVKTSVQGITKFVVICEEALLRSWKAVNFDEDGLSTPTLEADEVLGEEFTADMNDLEEAGFDITVVQDSDSPDNGPVVADIPENGDNNEAIALVPVVNEKLNTNQNQTTLQVTEAPRRASSFHIALRMSTICISFVDSFPQEIAVLHVTRSELTLNHRKIPAMGEEDICFTFSAQYVQLDNCVLNARLPVIVWPSNPRESFLQVKLEGKVTPQILMFSKCVATVTPFELFLEESVLLLALRMFQECKLALKGGNRPLSESALSDNIGFSDVNGIKAMPPTSFMGRMMFIERMLINPLAFNITIQRLVESDAQSVLGFPRWRGPGTSSSDIDDALVHTETILTALPSAFTDVDRASVSLSGFESRRIFSTIRQFYHRLKRKYSQELISNLYRILSTELMRVVSPIGGGLRVEDASSGLLHGAFGALDAASKVSGAIGSTAAYLSLDTKFVSARRQALIDERPDGLGTGVLLGAKAIGTGIVHGLAGVVVQPVMGASEGGVAGFVAGIGKGIVGVGVKPVVGVFDMVANVLAGARSATAWLDPSETPRRARLPRMIGAEARALQPYDARAALVQDLMVKLWGLERWRAAAQGDSSLEYRLLEPHSQVLVRVDWLLVCVDYGSYAQLLEAGRVDLGSFNAARPTLAWEVDGHAIASYEIDEENSLIVNVKLNHIKSGFGTRTASGDISYQKGSWILRLRAFDEDGLGFLCRALQRVVSAASSSQPAGNTHNDMSTLSMESLSGVSQYGLITTDVDGKCVVAGVQSGSQAERSGFLVGDVILAFFGRPLTAKDANGTTFHSAINHLSKEEATDCLMDVSVEREGLTKQVIVSFHSQ